MQQLGPAEHSRAAVAMGEGPRRLVEVPERGDDHARTSELPGELEQHP